MCLVIPKRPGEADETLADTTAIHSATGWLATHKLKEYVLSYVEGIKND